MSDPTVAARKAIYDRLVAADIGDVWSRPPDNSEPPYIVIGSINLEPALDKAGTVWPVTVNILSVTRDRSPQPAEALMVNITGALQGAVIAAPGFSFTAPRLEFGGAEEVEDKAIWIGRQGFRFTASI